MDSFTTYNEPRARRDAMFNRIERKIKGSRAEDKHGNTLNSN